MLEFSTTEVSEKSGATLRMLQNWAEKKIVRPARKGHSRVWSAKDVREARIVALLRARGLSTQRVRRVMVPIRAELQSGICYVATDGRTALVTHDAALIVRMMASHKGFFVLIEVPALGVI